MGQELKVNKTFRFTNEQDKDKFYAMLNDLMTENFPDVKIIEHNYFIDFMRDAPEVLLLYYLS